MPKNLLCLISALGVIGLMTSSCSAEDPAFTQASSGFGADGEPADAKTGSENSSARSSGDSVFEQGASSVPESIPDPNILFNQNGRRSASEDPAGAVAPGSLPQVAGSDPSITGEAASNQNTSEVNSGTPRDAGSGSPSTGSDFGSGLVSKTGTTSQTGSSTGTQSLQKRFAVKTVKDVAGAFYVEENWASQPIVLQNSTEAHEKIFTQITRPRLASSFKQGASGKSYIESIPQLEAAGVLDLVLVIDNSGSMKEEQENLSTKLAPLLSYISASDWKIGVVTTDPSDSCMRAVIGKGDVGGESAFANAVNAGLAGSGNEAGIRQAVTGLSCTNSSWTRPSATTAVLIVSDEDNCSNGQGCGTDPWNNENYLLNYLQNDMGKMLGTDARVYGLFKHPTEKNCSTAANTAKQYAAAVQNSGGTWGSICARDYTATLARISQDVSTILKKQFALKTRPDPASVGITLILQDGSRVPATGYSVSGEVITFTNAPPANSTIQVTYATPTEPQLDRFNLGNKALAGSAEVQINGTPVGQSSFTIRDQELVFVTPPPADSEIKVSFTKDEPLLKSFYLGSSIDTASIQVSIEKAVATSSAYTFDAATGFLNFVTAPNDGSAIEARFSKILGPKLSYSILTSGHAITEVKAQYSDNFEVKIAAVGNEVTLTQPDQARPGQTLWVQYRVSNETVSSYRLPSVPASGSLVLNASIEACQVGQQIIATVDTVAINCNFRGRLKIDYSYETETEPQRTFALDEISMPDAGSWFVAVDGAQIEETSFVREGNKITLLPNVELSNESIVTIGFSTKVN